MEVFNTPFSTTSPRLKFRFKAQLEESEAFSAKFCKSTLCFDPASGTQHRISKHRKEQMRRNTAICLLNVFIFTFFLAFVVITSYAQGDGNGYDYTIYRLQDKINNVLQTRYTKGMDFAIEVVSAETGEVLYTRQGTRPLIPASTMKLLTSATALTKLGTNYKFKTMILSDERPTDNGIINGNLYIKGFGDAEFNSSNLDSMIQVLRDMGIRVITGDIIGDESFFDNYYERSEEAPEEPTGKLPPLSALTLDRNSVKVYVEPGKRKDGRVEVRLFPAASSFFKIVNKAFTVTHRPRKTLTVTHTPQSGSIVITVSGEMRVGSYPKIYNLHVHSPAIYTSATLKDRLEQAGIKVNGKPKMGITPRYARLLTWHENALVSVVTQMNKMSDNFLAESMLKTLGAELKEQPGSTAGGLSVVKKFLKEAGIDTATCHLADGSGLSRQNEITCEALVKLLRYMYSNKRLFEAFYNSLAVAGMDGTLSGRLIGTAAENNVHGKTGTLEGVSSLAGYVTSMDGELLVFAINSQNFYKSKHIYKSLQDQIVAALASFSRKATF